MCYVLIKFQESDRNVISIYQNLWGFYLHYITLP